MAMSVAIFCHFIKRQKIILVSKYVKPILLLKVWTKACVGLLPCFGWAEHLRNLLRHLPPLLHARPRPHWGLPGTLLASLHQDTRSLVPRRPAQLCVWVDQHCHLFGWRRWHSIGCGSGGRVWMEERGGPTSFVCHCHSVGTCLSISHTSREGSDGSWKGATLATRKG